MKQRNKTPIQNFTQTLNKVYRFLAIRPRSEKEILDYLKKINPPASLKEKILKILKKQNLVNDREFTHWWIEQRLAFKPKGEIALKRELRQKGVNKEIIEKVVGKIDEFSLAKKAVEKKLKEWQNLSPIDFQKKLINFLSYRGFSWSTIEAFLSSCEKILK